MTDGNGACVQYTYDVRGDQVREEQVISEGIIKTIQEAVITYRQDGNGNITPIRTPEGY